jgi:NAD(P)-dependent dehydrogenase (short-subunit alcohol dehydrogenase family)
MNIPELFDLTGKTALITGAGRGLGRAISQGLAEAGADVVLVGRKIEALEETAVTVRAQGREALVLPADLSKPDEIEALLAQWTDTPNGIDILVNNAATSWAAPLHQYPLSGWDRVFDLNLRGLWLLTQGLTDVMRQRGGGSVINIASISAWLAGPDSEQPVVAYNASKGALLSLTRDLAVKLGPEGIRVNAVAPGPFLTDMMNHIREEPGRLEAHNQQIPLRRSGAEDDIKGVVVFLASGASAFMTGHTLVVDGGIRALYPIR